VCWLPVAGAAHGANPPAAVERSAVEGDATDVAVGQAIDHDREGPAAHSWGCRGWNGGGAESDIPPTLDPSGGLFPSSLSLPTSLMTRSFTQYVFDPAQPTMVLVPDVATDTGMPTWKDIHVIP
jgi:hypothetical protein